MSSWATGFFPCKFLRGFDISHVLLVQSDDGYLYPLERAFFYVQKPPTLLPHDEIDSVEFLRQASPQTTVVIENLFVGWVSQTLLIETRSH